MDAAEEKEANKGIEAWEQKEISLKLNGIQALLLLERVTRKAVEEEERHVR